MQYKLALREVLDPEDATNKATHDKTVEYLQVQSIAGLEKMSDAKLAIADKLTMLDGSHAFKKQGQAHKGK